MGCKQARKERQDLSQFEHINFNRHVSRPKILLNLSKLLVLRNLIQMHNLILDWDTFYVKT
jgi:hypothetical protein